MSLAGASTNWLYDGRGHATQATYTVPGLSSTRVFTWTYDSADRVQQIGYPAVGTNPRELLSYSYDSAWRPTSACSSFGGCYASSSQPYTALDQPKQWTFGNSLLQTWNYDTLMQRLQQLQVGTSADPGSLFTRSYTYDGVGNVESIADPQLPETQHFSYDHRDRLTHAWTTATLGSAPMRQTTQASLDTASATAFAPPASTARHAPHLAGAYPSMSVVLTPDLIASDSQASDAPSPAPNRAANSHTAAPATAPAAGAPPAPAAPRPDFSRLPLAFVPNQGLTDASVRFVVRSGLSTLFFTPDEVVLALPDASQAISTTIARLRYDGANPNPTLSARTPLPGVVNYFIGNNPALWQTNVPTYAGISYAALYTGIDLLYDGSDGKLKSTYLVAPGADPAQIRWRYPGATGVQVDSASGDLIISMPSPGAGQSGRTLIEHAPLAWQTINGQRVMVSARFAVAADQSVSFVLGSYDAGQSLTIDPILSYSSYLGGNGGDDGQGIAVDSSGNIYVAGSTRSSNFPVSASPFQSSRNGPQDAFVTKLNPSGSTVLYSTYLGGSAEDEAHAIAIDSGGKIFLTGETRSSNFPMQGALDSSYGGGSCQGTPCNDVFVTKLDPALSGSAQLKYSTYIGGNGEDAGFGIAADSTADSNAYVTGEIASGLPIPSKYYDTSVGGAKDGFLIKLKTTSTGGNSNMYATYLGGSGADDGAAVAIDSSGNAYVTGKTDSSGSFPTGFPTKNAYQGSKAGSPDAFVTKLDPSATTNDATLVYSTYLGGSAEDDGNGIAVDSSGIAYVTGYADSSNFPTVTPWQSAKAGGKDAFLATVNPALIGAPSLTYSTYLGGIAEERGLAIAVESANLVYLTGFTRSITFPVTLAPQPTFGGGTCGTISCTDSFITAFNLTANAPVYSTFLGGSNAEEGHAIAVDASGTAYVGGTTWSSNFPTASPRQGTFGGGTLDAFVAKLTQPPSGYDETYAYDSVGNITLKGPTGAGKVYSYGTQSASCASGALTKRHAVINDGSTTYCYDANGNMLSGGNRTYQWDAENRPTSITAGGVSETYTYDADGERLKVVRGSTTTVYVAGLWEELIGGAVKSYYALNGTVVALRDSGANAVTYLHGDHLGSVSLATNASGQGTPQYFGPWGARRAGGIAQTNRNYTGQYLDGTGLLYYHARYYDPVLGRFVSPDTLIPSVAPSIGGGGGALGRDSRSALRTLTVDFHEPGFAVALNGENRGGDQKLYHGGPLLPQALNRYSYVLNNPLLYVDPSGHQGLVEYALIGTLLVIVIVGMLTLSGSQSMRAIQNQPRMANPPSMAGEPASAPQPSPSPDLGPFDRNNVRVSYHFYQELEDEGITEQQAWRAYTRGKTYVDDKGSIIKYDPSTKVTVVVDPLDGEVVTGYIEPNPPSSWQPVRPGP